jgi:hypothetical protein
LGAYVSRFRAGVAFQAVQNATISATGSVLRLASSEVTKSHETSYMWEVISPHLDSWHGELKLRDWIEGQVHVQSAQGYRRQSLQS